LIYDSLPFLDVYTGTEIFARAFGCTVHYPADDMPFALPLVHSPAEAERLKTPGLDAAPFPLLFEIADTLRRRAGPEALLRLIDVQSPMDIAALIWEKISFFQALIETPEAVKELAFKVRQLLVAFLDEWFRRYGREFIAHYPDYYMAYGVTLSEDEVGSVSPSMFRQFFLPELVQLSERYGAMGLHCCANARHQWENFKEIPNLRLLNLVQPPDVTREAYGFFAVHTAQLHNYGGDGPAWNWPASYPAGARVVMDISVETREQALQISQSLLAHLEMAAGEKTGFCPIHNPTPGVS
jgi:uroporphyrinogen-III decarboxylase